MVLFTLDDNDKSNALSLLSLEHIFIEIKVVAKCEWSRREYTTKEKKNPLQDQNFQTRLRENYASNDLGSK